MKAPRPIIFALIGGSSSDETTRRIAPQYIADGWAGWAESQVLPHLDRYPGLVGFTGHNPLGTNGAEVMDFDQAIEARRTLMRRPGCSLDEWRAAWRRIVEAAAPGDCIAYIGTALKDADMVAREDSPGAWLQRWTDSLRPLLDVEGLRVGMDFVGQAPAGHPLVAGMLQLDAMGRPPLIEPWPSAGHEHLYDRDIWIVDDFYRNGMLDWGGGPDRWPAWAAKREEVTGTVHRFARYNAKDPRNETPEQRAARVLMTRDRIRDIVADGDRPIIRPDHLDWYMDTFEVTA